MRVGPLSAQQLLTDYFDVVTFWHSLEHVHDPKATLQEAYRILREGGVVTVQVPNIATILFWFFGQNYSMLQAPYHLYDFSPSTLGKLLQESGFDVYRTVYSPGTDGIALSAKNWWLSIRKMPSEQRSIAVLPWLGNNHGGAVTWFKRQVALPMLKPVGRLLALVGQGDVFSMYARKR